MADPPTLTAPVPVRERGYTRETEGNGYWDVLQQETTLELQWPNSIAVFNSMRRQDAQVSSVLRAVTTPILRTPWRIDGTGCRDEVTSLVAADLGLPIVGKGNDVPALRTRDRFSWPRHLRQALLMLSFGHSYFEQVYRIDEDGYARLRKLGYRPSHTIEKFNVARDGGLISIEQKATGSALVGTAGTVTLPVKRLVAYVLEQEGGDWIGTSLLRAAYKNWLLKDRLLRVDTQAIERNGMGIPIYKAAPNETDLSAGRSIATGVRSGDNSGAALPNGADLELAGVTGTLPKALDSVKYHDEQIARAVLAHFLNLGSQTGSWALGSTFADFFTLSLQSVAEEVRDVATAHIVEDMVDINFGPTEPAPRIVFDEIGSRGDAIVQAIATLVASKVLQPDEDLEKFVRTALGLPAPGGDPIAPEVPA